MSRPNPSFLRYARHSLAVARRRYERCRDALAQGDDAAAGRLLSLALRSVRRLARPLGVCLERHDIEPLERIDRCLIDEPERPLGPEVLIDVDALDLLIDRLERRLAEFQPAEKARAGTR